MEIPSPRPRPFLTLRNALAAGFFLALVAFFARSLIELAVYAWNSDLHSHIVLVPLISAYLIAVGRQGLPRLGRPSFLFGAFFAIFGVVAFLFASRLAVQLSQNDRLALVSVSFLCLLWAGGFLFLGWKIMRAVLFPLAFLVFIIPLPDATVDWLETASKYASADAAAFILGLSDVPMLREGLLFRLPGIAIEVAPECSGIRSSWVLFITSLLAAHLFLRSGWRRAVLVAFVIPLGIIRNGFRIAVIGWLCAHYGPQMINHFIHRKGGPFFFVLSLGPLFALLWWLRHSEAKHSSRASAQ